MTVVAVDTEPIYYDPYDYGPPRRLSEEELVMVRTSTVRGFSSVPVHLD